MSSDGRLVPDIPRWTKHQDEDRLTKSLKNGKPTGMDFYTGRATCWCYLCGSEHRASEPCMKRSQRAADTSHQRPADRPHEPVRRVGRGTRP